MKDREQFNRLVRFVEMFLPERVKDIVLYTGDEPIFDAYGIEDEIGRALNPAMVAQQVEGGFQLSGRWSFSSGCDHCQWVLLGGLVFNAEGNVVVASPAKQREERFQALIGWIDRYLVALALFAAPILLWQLLERL